VFEGKRILKTAAADMVPEQIRMRPKKGFGAPVGPWFQTMDPRRLEALVDTLADVIDPSLFRTVISEHRSGTVDHRRRLWSAHVLAGWRTSKWGRAP
jgi:asparagine synthase (glutamine-hydrolysing)